MKRYLFPPVLALVLTGCIATAPVSVSWRSNTSQQYATTDGRTDKGSDSNTVNADRTTETQAAVTTSSGAASTAPQNTLQDAVDEPEITEVPETEEPEIPAEVDAE